MSLNNTIKSLPIYLALVFLPPFIFSHDVKEIDITNRCSIERDKIEFGNFKPEFFYRVTAALSNKEIIDHSPVPGSTKLGDSVLGRFPLKLTLNVDGVERVINGVLMGVTIIGLPPSTVTGIPTYDISNSLINDSENVSIRKCIIYVD